MIPSTPSLRGGDSVEIRGTRNNTVLGRNALRYTTTGSSNTVSGVNALFSNITGDENVAVGVSALLNNTTGNANIAIGMHSLSNNTSGSSNTAIGRSALQSNTTGLNNTAIGRNSLVNNTSGNTSVAIGNGALNRNTIGDNNVAIGANLTLHSNTTGSRNIAVGSQALMGNTTGSRNIAVGSQTLQNNITGYQNTVMGDSTLWNNTTGNHNTAIGVIALQNNTTGSNLSGFGNGARAPADNSSNMIVFGNSQITQLRCQVTTITALSDERTKEYHKHADLSLCYDAVRGLPVSRYKYKDFTGKHVDANVTGFMAEDMEKVFPKSVSTTDYTFHLYDNETGEPLMETVEVEKEVEVVEVKQGRSVKQIEVDSEAFYALDPKEQEELPRKVVCKKVMEERQKTHFLPDVKEITPTELVPTLWGAVQQLMHKVEELEAERGSDDGARLTMPSCKSRGKDKWQIFRSWLQRKKVMN